MVTLLLATRNAHKVREIQRILGENFRCLTLVDFPGAPAVKEDADTFAGNAILKAMGLARWLTEVERSTPNIQRSTSKTEVWPQFVLADDSGLEVDALDGAPSVHSARFAALDGSAASSSAGGNSPDADNNAKLLDLLKVVPTEKRTARFRCVMALVEMTPHSALRTPHLFEGVCEGRIDFSPRGQGGFGYDPLFIPDGFQQSFAELGEDRKNDISHRARALAALKTRLHP